MGGFELQDELQAILDTQNYNITNEHDLTTEDPAHLLEGIRSLTYLTAVAFTLF